MPEIGRYLAENVREETLKRHAYGKSRFPLWWMLDAPYFQRDYTGDEGVGLVQPEMMGSIFPIERWVVGADAAARGARGRRFPRALDRATGTHAVGRARARRIAGLESGRRLGWRDLRRGYALRV